MSGPAENLAKGWELISSKIDMDTPTPLGRYLGSDHTPERDIVLSSKDHPFAHVFDKSIPDPAAKKAAPAATNDYVESVPELGVTVHNHVQPRKMFFCPCPADAEARNIGSIRYTEFNECVPGGSPGDQWDTCSSPGKRGALWTGRTFFFRSDMSKTEAVAAVKKVRNKTAAKKEARQQAFFDINFRPENSR
jgi:hypothetical protein